MVIQEPNLKGKVTYGKKFGKTGKSTGPIDNRLAKNQKQSKNKNITTVEQKPLVSPPAVDPKKSISPPRGEKKLSPRWNKKIFTKNLTKNQKNNKKNNKISENNQKNIYLL